MFPLIYYEKLDPYYRKALKKLKNELKYEKKPHSPMETLTDLSSKIILEFASNYLTPKEFWQKLWELNDSDTANRLSILPAVIYHSAYNDLMKYDLHNDIIPKIKLLDKYTQQQMYGHYTKRYEVEDLCFPHNMLEFYLHEYENIYRNSHLPTKIIKRRYEMKKLYEKIKFVEGNEEEWINAMAESDDIEFVKHNIEFKLGQDLTNKKLWILYIKYLKEQDIKPELLQVYSKYCRFFVDVISLKEEYKNAAEKFGKPTVPWKNAFDFEIFDDNLLKVENKEIPEQSPPKRPTQHIPCAVVFKNKEVANQKFPFRPNLMIYIVKSAKSNELQKLNFSCKYFYLKYRIPVCYNFFVSSSGPAWAPFEVKEESLFFHSDTLEEVDYSNLYISTKFSYIHSVIPLWSIIPKLYKCDAKYIDLRFQDLTMDEFKFFVGHGNVIDLRFFRLKIICANGGERLFLEDILALMPKLQYLCAVEAYCSPITAQKLCKLPFENKFLRFELRNGTNIPLDHIAFGNFIIKNASPDSRITVDKVGNAFEASIKEAIESHWKTSPKPTFSLYGYF